MSLLSALSFLGGAPTLRIKEQRDDSRIGLMARGSATARRMWRRAAPAPKVPPKLTHQDTRQRTFARLFAEEFAHMKHYDAPRHIRRLMARRSARRLMAEAQP